EAQEAGDGAFDAAPADEEGEAAAADEAWVDADDAAVDVEGAQDAADDGAAAQDEPGEGAGADAGAPAFGAPAPKRRGRPPKHATALAGAPASADPAPRRRGRPPKNPALHGAAAPAWAATERMGATAAAPATSSPQDAAHETVSTAGLLAIGIP